MDCQDYITESVERKKGQHLQREERGAIQHLKNAGYTNRAIARAIGCSPTTVGNELKRGTPPRKSSKGRKPGYSARHGEAVYKANRKRSRKPHRICHCTPLHSLDNGTGQRTQVVLELPEAMKRKQHKDSKPREHKKNFGTDISQMPEIAACAREGRWEGDTVVGKRAGKEAVVLSLLEKKTENYIAIRIPRQGCRPVPERHAVAQEEFRKVHRSSRPLPWTTARSSLRSVRSRTGLCSLLCTSLYLVGTSPKRASQWAVSNLSKQRVPIESFSSEYILSAADELNGRPRKKLGYCTPEELFDEFLDSVYAAEGCGSIARTEANGFHPDRRSDSLSSTVQVSNLHLQFIWI